MVICVILKQNNKCMNIKVCNNIFSRFKGFMFKKSIDIILCFPKCNSVHTFFMKCPIDIIMTDKNYKVLLIYKNFQKNKVILPKKNVYYTFEMPTNTFSLNVGENLTII